MRENKRNGHRKSRAASRSVRRPEFGYYCIFTDTTETERNYLYGLKDLIPENLKNKIVIKVERAATSDLVKKCRESLSLEPQYRIPWIVFDCDQVKYFDKIIAEAENADIRVGWSNPCIEIWFHAYFGAMPTCPTSAKCCEKFRHEFKLRTGQEYNKTDSDIYAKLCKYGDEEKAISFAEKNYSNHQKRGNRQPSEMCPSTTLFILIAEIKDRLSEMQI